LDFGWDLNRASVCAADACLEDCTSTGEYGQM